MYKAFKHLGYNLTFSHLLMTFYMYRTLSGFPATGQLSLSNIIDLVEIFATSLGQPIRHA